MNQIDVNVKTHFLTFKDHTQADRDGKPVIRTVYMSRVDFEPIQRALDAGRADIFIRALDRNIPKRNYEASGRVNEDQLRPTGGGELSQYLVVCACGEKIPYYDFYRHSSSRECRDGHFAKIRQKINLVQ